MKRISTVRPHFQRRASQTPSAQQNGEKMVLPVIEQDQNNLKVTNEIQTEVHSEIEMLKSAEEENLLSDRGS